MLPFVDGCGRAREYQPGGGAAAGAFSLLEAITAATEGLILVRRWFPDGLFNSRGGVVALGGADNAMLTLSRRGD
jgi:hypothetical protein